jgi:hypothetical protein
MKTINDFDMDNRIRINMAIHERNVDAFKKIINYDGMEPVEQALWMMQYDSKKPMVPENKDMSEEEYVAVTAKKALGIK